MSVCALVMVTVSFILILFNLIPFLLSLTHTNSWYARWINAFQRIWSRYIFGLMGMFDNPTIHITFGTSMADEERAALCHLFDTPSIRTILRPELDPSGKDDSAVHPPNRLIVMANHQIYLDWIYLWEFLRKMELSGWVKIILKRSLMKLPVVGFVCIVSLCLT